MVGINPKLTQNYQLQPKKVAAQEGDKPQQTQQAETQAVKQPAVQTLQQSTVRVPLENLQLNAGITVGGSTNTPKAQKMADIFIKAEELAKIIGGDKPLAVGDRIFMYCGNNSVVIMTVTSVEEDIGGKYNYTFETEFGG